VVCVISAREKIRAGCKLARNFEKTFAPKAVSISSRPVRRQWKIALSSCGSGGLMPPSKRLSVCARAFSEIFHCLENRDVEMDTAFVPKVFSTWRGEFCSQLDFFAVQILRGDLRQRIELRLTALFDAWIRITQIHREYQFAIQNGVPCAS